MTMFSRAEYERLWSIVGVPISAEFANGRGPKCKNTSKDVFFMMVNVIHTPTKWAKHGIDFSMKAPTIEKQVWKVSLRLIGDRPLSILESNVSSLLNIAATDDDHCGTHSQGALPEAGDHG